MDVNEIRKMKESLCNTEVKNPENLVVDLLIPDRGWFRFTKSGVYQITLAENDLLFDELTYGSAEFIRKEALEILDR